MKVKEILVINQPVGNRGDESAHRALVRSLNRALPDTHVTVLSFMDYVDGIAHFRVDAPQNEYVRFVFPHNCLADPFAQLLVKIGLCGIGTRLHPVLRHLLPYYQRADVVICAPGGICMGGFQNWRHLYLLQLARCAHKPLVYYSRSIGPFPVATLQNRRFKQLSLRLLRAFNFLSLRDRKSKLLADQLGLRYVSSIDTAFLYRPQASIPSTLQTSLSAPYVVFVPNQLVWHYAYRQCSPKVIDHFFLEVMRLLRQQFAGHQIVMLPQLCDMGKDGDYSYFLRLAAQAKMENVFVVPDTYGSDVQQQIVSHAAMVVGARYHTIVFAVNNEVPFVALSYEHKIAGLLQELQLEDHLMDITDAFSSDATCQEACLRFGRLCAQMKGVPPRRTTAHQLAADCFDSLTQYLSTL